MLIREVKSCNCFEHQAANRYRELIAKLDEERAAFREALAASEALVARLEEDLHYWQERSAS
jgi:hypothetical protein